MSYKIILLGKLACGKGTQADILSDYLKIPVIPTGNLYRQEIENNTEIGKLAKNIIDVGLFMPDEITNNLIASKIHNHSNGFIIEGYPRTFNQAAFIKDDVNLIIDIDISDEEVYRRLEGRLVHKKSGRTYHCKYNPPLIFNRDNLTGEVLERRIDDDPKIIKNRLIEYKRECVGIGQYFKDNGLRVENVSGEGSIEQVAVFMKKIIGSNN